MDIADTIWLHICDLRSHTTSKKLFSIEILLILPCITAIATSHKQKEDVWNGTTNDFPLICLPTACKPENGQTSHISFLKETPGQYISSETIKTKIKAAVIK